MVSYDMSRGFVGGGWKTRARDGELEEIEAMGESIRTWINE